MIDEDTAYNLLAEEERQHYIEEEERKWAEHMDQLQTIQWFIDTCTFILKRY